MNLFLRLLIFASVASLVVGASSDECFQAGQCRESHHLGGDSVPDEEACRQLCISNIDCHWFTFMPSVDFCEMYTECTQLDNVLCEDCLSGSRNCTIKEPECWLAGECHGILDQFQKVETKEECLSLCQSTADCRWFTFRQPSSPCFLFRTCTSVNTTTCPTCISGERSCRSEPYLTKLMVAGSSNSTTVEVINLSNQDSSCHNLQDLPHGNHVNGGLGFLWQNKIPFFCGGHVNDSDICDCYTFTNGSWNEFTSGLNHCRRYAAVVPLEVDGQEVMLAIAGAIGVFEWTNNVELFDGNSWHINRVADVPVEVTQSCAVRIDKTRLLLAGGIENKDYPSESFIYDSSTNAWTSGPPLNRGRNGPACGLLKSNNQETGEIETFIVFAGGHNLKTVEILNANRISDGWMEGPDLPHNSFISSLTSYGDGLILTGGVDAPTDLYRLDSPAGPWKKIPIQLASQRQGHVAYLIPDSLTECD